MTAYPAFDGIQDLIGDRFAALGTVTTFSWLSADARGRDN